MSKGSCAEVRNLLILARELKFCDENEVTEAYDLSVRVSKELSNFIVYLTSKVKA